MFFIVARNLYEVSPFNAVGLNQLDIWTLHPLGSSCNSGSSAEGKLTLKPQKIEFFFIEITLSLQWRSLIPHLFSSLLSFWTQYIKTPGWLPGRMVTPLLGWSLFYDEGLFFSWEHSLPQNFISLPLAHLL